MQSTGHTGRHLPQPEQSSGMMMTSIPWLKMAPNCGGQWRMHVSQLMHSAISMKRGRFFHLGLRSRVSRRSPRVAGIEASLRGRLWNGLRCGPADESADNDGEHEAEDGAADPHLGRGAAGRLTAFGRDQLV